MHTIELLEQALSLAQSMGYGIRHEWLGGRSGGRCEIAGKKWLFVDLALNPIEQLDQVQEALLADPQIHGVSMPQELRASLGLRKIA
jgi:hypothetical protein